MVPFHPPLPMAWKALFQPEAGSQSSTLMSESLDGVKVAITRQKAGRLLKSAGLGPKGPGVAGDLNAPAATLCAELMVTFGRLSLERLSHVDPPVGAAASATGSSKIPAIENLGESLDMDISSGQLYIGVPMKETGAGVLF